MFYQIKGRVDRRSKKERNQHGRKEEGLRKITVKRNPRMTVVPRPIKQVWVRAREVTIPKGMCSRLNLSQK